MPLFAVTYAYGKETAAGRDEVRPRHREFLEQQFQQDVLRVSGPFGPGEDPGALLLIEADSKEAVAELLDGDPFATSGLVAERTIRQWDIVFGSLAR